MQVHDNARLSVREQKTDSPPILFRIDWPVVFRVVARFMLLLCVLVATIATVGHLHRYGLGAVQSLAQCLTVCSFLAVAMVTDSPDMLLAMAALGILATLAL
jgi:hypothetical protein